MTDFHVHIGQWYNSYYSSRSVFTALKATGTDEVWFSSTSSERYCTESANVLCGKVKATGLPTARELYETIREEIKTALEHAESVGLKAHPLYWVIPEIHKSKSSYVTIEKAMSELPYEGFKLHPRGNFWDLQDDKTIALAEEVFSYAEKYNLLVLIHCGPDPFELPTKFESFIAHHPKCTVQLAHTRPLEKTLYMLKKYPNTLCDIAFTPDDVQKSVIEAGFEKRMRYGTDFPITHWYERQPEHNPTEEELIKFLSEKNNI